MGIEWKRYIIIQYFYLYKIYNLLIYDRVYSYKEGADILNLLCKLVIHNHFTFYLLT